MAEVTLYRCPVSVEVYVLATSREDAENTALRFAGEELSNGIGRAYAYEETIGPITTEAKESLPWVTLDAQGYVDANKLAERTVDEWVKVQSAARNALWEAERARAIAAAPPQRFKGTNTPAPAGSHSEWAKNAFIEEENASSDT